MSAISTKPYLVRAIYEWCCDQGFTPYLSVIVDEHTMVPHEHVLDGQIVLNVSPVATNALTMGNDFIEFQARFGGAAHQLSIPVANVNAIYARENGHGMAFEVDLPLSESEEDSAAPAGDRRPVLAAVPSADEPAAELPESSDEPDDTPPAPSGRPHLKRVK